MPKRKLVPHVVNEQELTILPPHTLVSEAVGLMVARDISAVMITKDGAAASNLLGIFTERDLVTRVVGTGRNPRRTRLSEVMTREPDTLPPDARAIDALNFMRIRHYRHLPVVDDERIVGMVSIRNLFAVVTEQLEDDVHECEAFVFGSAYSVDKTHQHRRH